MTPIPAGLEDGNIEMYRTGTTVCGLHNGARYKYYELPIECREPFAVELINDKKATDYLLNAMKVPAEDAEEKFVWCRYGHFNNMPDYSFVTRQTKPDAPGCEHESTCPGFGIVCLLPEGVNGKVSRQEYFVLRLVARGLGDKQIASELNIEITTVRTHIQRIHHKLALNSRVQICMWAQQHGIE